MHVAVRSCNTQHVRSKCTQSVTLIKFSLPWTEKKRFVEKINCVRETFLWLCYVSWNDTRQVSLTISTWHSMVVFMKLFRVCIARQWSSLGIGYWEYSVRNNDVDKPVARHFNTANHFTFDIKVCAMTILSTVHRPFIFRFVSLNTVYAAHYTFSYSTKSTGCNILV